MKHRDQQGVAPCDVFPCGDGVPARSSSSRASSASPAATCPPQRQRDPRGVRQGIRKRLHQRGAEESSPPPALRPGTTSPSAAPFGVSYAPSAIHPSRCGMPKDAKPPLCSTVRPGSGPKTSQPSAAGPGSRPPGEFNSPWLGKTPRPEPLLRSASAAFSDGCFLTDPLETTRPQPQCL